MWTDLACFGTCFSFRKKIVGLDILKTNLDYIEQNLKITNASQKQKTMIEFFTDRSISQQLADQSLEFLREKIEL